MNTPSAPAMTYEGRVTNWPILIGFVVLALPFIWLSADTQTGSGLALPSVIVGVALIATLLTASSLRTTAGPNGVVARFGPLGWPRFRYPIDQISHAEVVSIPAWSMLSWGIFWSSKLGLVLALRSGAALQLHLTNGRKVTISTQDPSAAIHALNARRPRR